MDHLPLHGVVHSEHQYYWVPIIFWAGIEGVLVSVQKESTAQLLFFGYSLCSSLST